MAATAGLPLRNSIQCVKSVNCGLCTLVFVCQSNSSFELFSFKNRMRIIG